MHPKIASHQDLPATKITGPINWESDDAAAVFSVVVSQVVSKSRAIGIGMSGVCKPTTDPGNWSADVEILTGTFQKGGATVYAWASIAQPDGGWEMYPWGRAVELS